MRPQDLKRNISSPSFRKTFQQLTSPQRSSSLKSRKPSSDSIDVIFTTVPAPGSPPKLKRRDLDRVSISSPVSAGPSRCDSPVSTQGGSTRSSADGPKLSSDKRRRTFTTVDERKEHRFDDQNRTVLRRGMPHHPFTREDAPYMVSYSPVMLDNDYYAHQLLCIVNPTGSPSFHDYGRNPPSNVLDIGCGEGHWVLQAARAWKASGTQVTGLDLVDLYNNHSGEVFPDLNAESGPKNVTWTRGNFVKHRLPFPDNTFDFVRMANLSLAIPYDLWPVVLAEAKRVLAPGGRLELIDDELIFPPIPPPPISPRHINDGEEIPHKRRRAVHGDLLHQGQQVDTDTEMEYEANACISIELETIYRSMLYHKYCMYLTLHEILLTPLRHVFGDWNVGRPLEFSLAIPPRDSLKVFFGNIEVKEGRAKVLDDSVDELHTLSRTSPKTASSLKVGSGRKRESKMYQPPGLVLLPASVLVPFSPLEMEMHACKHMNVLLGSRNALINFVLEQTDISGHPLLSEAEMDDYLAVYDRFKRTRLHWPMDYTGMRLEDDSPDFSPLSSIFRLGTTSPSGRERSESNPLTRPVVFDPKDYPEMTDVRTIRVFSAIKSADESPSTSR